MKCNICKSQKNIQVKEYYYEVWELCNQCMEIMDVSIDLHNKHGVIVDYISEEQDGDWGWRREFEDGFTDVAPVIFIHNGTAIVNPTVDETGRFKVDADYYNHPILNVVDIYSHIYDNRSTSK